MKPKILKVNCSFCGIEIECPEEMKDMEKHLCFNCFQNLSEHEFEDIEKIHVEIPSDKLEDIILDALMTCIINDLFPRFWKDKRRQLKNMRKKEMAKEAFAAGASATFHLMRELGEKLDDDDFIKELANYTQSLRNTLQS